MTTRSLLHESLEAERSLDGAVAQTIVLILATLGQNSTQRGCGQTLLLLTQGSAQNAVVVRIGDAFGDQNVVCAGAVHAVLGFAHVDVSGTRSCF